MNAPSGRSVRIFLVALALLWHDWLIKYARAYNFP